MVFPSVTSRLIPFDLISPDLILSPHIYPRDPQERTEPLVSEETKEILASWVPGASRWEGD